LKKYAKFVDDDFLIFRGSVSMSEKEQKIMVDKNKKTLQKERQSVFEKDYLKKIDKRAENLSKLYNL